MPNNKVSNQEGFTLIELLITLVVLSFGLLGLAGLQAQMIRTNAFNKDMMIATSIGADLLEEAKSAGLAQVLTLFNPSNPLTAPLYGDTVGDGVVDRDFSGDGNPDDPYSGHFTWTRVVTVAPGGLSRFVSVTVSVFWSDPLKQHRLDFTTVIG